MDSKLDPLMRARLLKMIRLFALKKREVVLASGQKSNIYLDCRQVYLKGEGLFIIGELFLERLLAHEANLGRFDALGGMAMGAIPLTCALSLAAFSHGRELPSLVVRKEGKEHGLGQSIDGDQALFLGARVLILEDVVTTAGSAIMAIEKLRARGAIIDTVFSLVDREQGGYFNLQKIGVRLEALFTLDEVVGALNVDRDERAIS